MAFARSQASWAESMRAIGKERLPHLLDEGEPALALHLPAEALPEAVQSSFLFLRRPRGRRGARGESPALPQVILHAGAFLGAQPGVGVGDLDDELRGVTEVHRDTGIGLGAEGGLHRGR